MKAAIDDLFRKGIEARNKGAMDDAIMYFSKILKEFPEHRQLGGVHTVLAGVFHNLGNIRKSIFHFKKATISDPASELASLGLYVSYVEAKEDEKALNEIIRYLSSNPARIYKDTLKELLVDVKSGNLERYKKVILELANANGVSP
jgi:tetratricopeptide (TPR) repeat protein